MRRVIIQAIKALQPDPSCSLSSRSWRNYQILFYRYVQQLPQRDVANQLGISARHLRREETVAIESLALNLCARYHLPRHLGSSLARVDTQRDSNEVIDREMRHLSDTLIAEVADVSSVLAETKNLIQSLARHHQVLLDVRADDCLLPVAVPQMVLKEVLLNLMSTAIGAVPGGTVSITADIENQEVILSIKAFGASPNAWQKPQE
ncbi:MAG: hypothetical protein H5T92_10510, partial [Synergistales bacterium]|nr:hypothetical protein [Synergistales bacterium]